MAGLFALPYGAKIRKIGDKPETETETTNIVEEQTQVSFENDTLKSLETGIQENIEEKTQEDKDEDDSDYWGFYK